MAAGVLGLAAGGSAAAPQAISCPSALGEACGPVDLIIGTACYQPIPPIPTVGPVTLSLEGRLLYCPEL